MPSSAAHRRVKAIYIVGPSSTGKTTLCKALVAQLGLPPSVYITEVARTVMRETGFTRRDVARVEMQKAIMDKQLEQDAAARAVAGGGDGPGVVLSDRSAIDAVVYAALADAADGGTRSLTLIQAPEFQTVLPAYRCSTFVLLQPIPEWLHDDGVRSLENGWQCYTEFRRIFAKFGIPYVELGESCRFLEERVALVRTYVNLS